MKDSAACYNKLGMVFKNKGNYNQALEYYNLTLSLCN